MYIPSELGYGDRGSPPKIGGGDVLIFQMEILAIQGETVPALNCSIDGDDESAATRPKAAVPPTGLCKRNPAEGTGWPDRRQQTTCWAF